MIERNRPLRQIKGETTLASVPQSYNTLASREASHASEEGDAPEGANTPATKGAKARTSEEARATHPTKDSVTTGPSRTSEDDAVSIFSGNDFEHTSDSEGSDSFWNRLICPFVPHILLAHQFLKKLQT